LKWFRPDVLLPPDVVVLIARFFLGVTSVGLRYESGQQLQTMRIFLKSEPDIRTGCLMGA